MNNINLLTAVNFAAKKHKNQCRKDRDSSPYINHPIAVAHLISEIGGISDTNILTAAILHDTIEDTNTSPREIEELFGDELLRIIEEVSDNKSLPKQKRKELQIKHAKSLSEEAVIIKLADKTLNIVDITDNPPADWDLDRRIQYLDWAEAVIDNCPKANEYLLEYFYKTLKTCKRKISE